MNHETLPSQITSIGETVDNKVNLSRRRLGLAGAAGTGLLMTVASRSAMAGENSCGSEMASGNLSKQLTGNDCGCSPGFWWNTNGLAKWTKYLEAHYSKSANFNSVFKCTYLAPDKSLSACGGPGATAHTLAGTMGSLNIPDTVVANAVAALLNVKYYGATRYPASPPFTSADNVIDVFKAAVAIASDGSKSSVVRKSAMTEFLARCDIYTSKTTWCFGTLHG